MRLSVLMIFTLAMVLIAPLGSALAQDVPPVQELHGSLTPEQIDVFSMAGLKQRQIQDAFLENSSGNLLLFIAFS